MCLFFRTHVKDEITTFCEPSFQMKVCVISVLCMLLIAGVSAQSEFAGYAPPPEHETERPGVLTCDVLYQKA